MKNKKIKVIFGIISLFVIFITFLIYIWCNKKYDIGPVAQKIINEIDHLENSNSECIVDLNKITDFEWDKVIIVSADFLAIGYSKEKIKSLWGIEYEFQPGFKSRLIFIKNDSIVYEEAYLSSIENSVKFNISTSSKLDYYKILSNHNAKIVAGRNQYNSKEYCYSLMIE